MRALALALALAAAPGPALERLTWEVEALGAVVGRLELEVRTFADGSQQLDGRAVSAPWFRATYALDDRLRSLRAPGGGSRGFEASYREGRHALDLAFTPGPEGVFARRSRPGGEPWHDRYPAVSPEVEDPLSALQRLRELPLHDGAVHHIPVFDGRRLTGLDLRVVERGACPAPFAGRRCVEVEANPAHDPSARARLVLTDDARRLPLRMGLSAPLFVAGARLTEGSPAP